VNEESKESNVTSVDALKQRAVWITYLEARAMSGLSRSTLLRLAESGAIKAARVNRAVRIHQDSLEKFMERQVIGGDED
jgi:excisionase family DNA binding protein